MADCCDPRGCDREFDDRFARRSAAAYRSQGLSRSAEAMVSALERRGIEGASVLEIGGGVGAIHLELLRRGAATATNLELSPAYDAEAARLVAEAGLTGRVTRRIADLAVDADAADDADVVVLHRVVCCYPDYRRLLGAAASRARRLLVFSYPPRTLLTRGVVALDAARQRLVGREYRAFAHPPEVMFAVLAAAGLAPERIHRDLAWRAALAERRDG
ncbi:methyltransferase domain-containing protein [Actinotalea solisilvae]|uniref:methyltransferase domain-containing protein n=1 Tax=Actinotalea solisilvae TaxID=2072922 RepID=UPI0018F2538E|nr:methyltransferase domain-containing protein [Actinotalea solisilvae]